MAYIPYDESASRRGVIQRLARTLLARSNEVLDWTEDMVLFFEPSGLGIRVGIRSIRTRELFASLHNKLTPGFEPHNFRIENGREFARFGYS
jgi:hypothetical protein